MASSTDLDAALVALTKAAASVPTEATVFVSLTDDTLLAAQRSLAAVRRAVDAASAAVAGEIGRRSHPSLGHSGLAQRSGFRTPEKLVQHETGSTARDATTLVKAGALMLDAQQPTPSGAVWMREVGAAVAAGSVSIAVATSIQAGLGEPGPGVTAEQLASAVAVLLTLALDADAMFRRARELRDDLDEAGIVERERLIYEQRSVRRVRRANGLNRFIIDADLESTAYLDSLYDGITSPRRGGPRFVDPDERAWAEAVVADGRTTDQYVHDGFVQLLRAGASADESRLIVGPRSPGVRLLANITALEAAARGHDVEGNGGLADVGARLPGGVRAGGVPAGGVVSDGVRAGGVLSGVTFASAGSEVADAGPAFSKVAPPPPAGHGRIEGLDIPVSIATIERNTCDVGTVTIDFFTGQPLDVGREQRLFTARQRIALAARDGGCRWPGCDRPPSWCEAHHIRHWKRDHGPTDVANGILLCRHHHLLLHDNNWEIVRRGADYWLVPPAVIDPRRTPLPMPSKSAALRDLERDAASGVRGAPAAGRA